MVLAELHDSETVLVRHIHNSTFKFYFAFNQGIMDDAYVKAELDEPFLIAFEKYKTSLEEFLEGSVVSSKFYRYGKLSNPSYHSKIDHKMMVFSVL